MPRPDLTELQNLDNTSQAYNQLKTGRRFVSSTRKTGVTDQSVAFDVLIKNNENSGVDLLYIKNFATGGAAALDITTEASVDTAGTALPIQNKGAENGALDITLEIDGAYSATGETIESFLPGTQRAGGPNTTTGQSNIPDARLLEPGEAITYTLTNISGTQTTFGVDIAIIEINPEEQV